MRTDYQLISAVPDRFRQEIGQNQLILRTQAVFRLVQQAQGIHLNLALEEHDCVFSVGPFPQAFPGFIFDKAAFGLASGLVDPVQIGKPSESGICVCQIGISTFSILADVSAK